MAKWPTHIPTSTCMMWSRSSEKCSCFGLHHVLRLVKESLHVGREFVSSSGFSEGSLLDAGENKSKPSNRVRSKSPKYDSGLLGGIPDTALKLEELVVVPVAVLHGGVATPGDAVAVTAPPVSRSNSDVKLVTVRQSGESKLSKIHRVSLTVTMFVQDSQDSGSEALKLECSDVMLFLSVHVSAAARGTFRDSDTMMSEASLEGTDTDAGASCSNFGNGGWLWNGLALVGGTGDAAGGGGSSVHWSLTGGSKQGELAGFSWTPSSWSSLSMYLSVLKMSTERRSDGSCLHGAGFNLNIEMSRMDLRCSTSATPGGTTWSVPVSSCWRLRFTPDDISAIVVTSS